MPPQLTGVGDATRREKDEPPGKRHSQLSLAIRTERAARADHLPYAVEYQLKLRGNVCGIVGGSHCRAIAVGPVCRGREVNV
jgi:hypothetical protein